MDLWHGRGGIRAGGGDVTPRQAYVAKRLGIVAVIGLALFGWVHGIYWAGGINQPGNSWHHGSAPWQAALIDFAPIWLCIAWLFGGMFVSIGAEIAEELGLTLWGGYKELPKAPTKAERLAAKQAEREANIARLERELGLVPQAPWCSHRYRLRLVTVGFPDREVCKYCGKVFDDSWRAEA